jgi:formamidopyrimidine-DNA glycosylase
VPELPEVETVRRGLQELIIGRIVKAVEHDWPKSFTNAAAVVKQFLSCAWIVDVRLGAYVLLIDLSTEYTLVIHLKMTGQLVFRTKNITFGAGHPNDSLVSELPDRSTHVTFLFMDGSHLYFNDQRKFGWVRLVPTIEVPNIDFMRRVGPEPLEAEFTAEQFTERFKRRARSPIKAALLDQTVIAGVGNIYADESLWGAKIHPQTLVKDISKKQFEILFNELRYVLNLSIEKGGSTDRNYVNAEGKKGSYIDFARAFRQEGKPCPRCGTTIIKMRAAGRGTHICPYCQVLE